MFLHVGLTRLCYSSHLLSGLRLIICSRRGIFVGINRGERKRSEKSIYPYTPTSCPPCSEAVFGEMA